MEELFLEDRGFDFSVQKEEVNDSDYALFIAVRD